MSIRIMNHVWSLVLPVTQKFILLALADRANDDGICWPGQESLAKKCSIPDRTLRWNLKKLEAAGYLQIVHRPGDGHGRKTNIYHLTLEGVKNTEGNRQSLPDEATGNIEHGNRQYRAKKGGATGNNVADNTSDIRQIDTSVYNAQGKNGEKLNPFAHFPAIPDPEQWAEIMSIRKKKKATNSQRAFNAIGNQLTRAVQAGYSFQDCMDVWERRQWKAFELSWYESQRSDNNATSKHPDKPRSAADKARAANNHRATH